jgi:hypothetical protein
MRKRVLVGANVDKVHCKHITTDPRVQLLYTNKIIFKKIIEPTRLVN